MPSLSKRSATNTGIVRDKNEGLMTSLLILTKLLFQMHSDKIDEAVIGLAVENSDQKFNNLAKKWEYQCFYAMQN